MFRERVFPILSVDNLITSEKFFGREAIDVFGISVEVISGVQSLGVAAPVHTKADAFS